MILSSCPGDVCAGFVNSPEYPDDYPDDRHGDIFSHISAFSTRNYEQLIICIHLDVIILVLTNYTL